MIAIASRNTLVVYVRAEPGENIHEVLYRAVADHGLVSAAVVSVAGSAESIRYGVVSVGRDRFPRYTEVVEEHGAIELTGLQGHVGTEGGGAMTAHLHGSFARADGSVIAGHLYQARALVTVEMTVLGASDVSWIRSEQEYGSEGHRMPILVPVAHALASQA